MRAIRTLWIGCGLVLSMSAGARGAEFRWQPLSATGSHQINGSEIILQGAGQRVTLELLLFGWDPDVNNDPQLSAFQATLDPSSYNNGLGAALFPLVDRACTVNGDCDTGACGTVRPGICDDPHPQDGAFQIAKKCFVGGQRCVIDADCPAAPPPGNFCIANTEFPFPTGITAVSTGTLDYQYLAATQSSCVNDNGTTWHGGILIVEVPAGARGTYTIGFINDPDLTTMKDCNVQPILPISLFTAQISLACGSSVDCDDGNACTTDVCGPTGTCTNTANYNTAQFCCNPTNGNLTQLSDNNDCTADICNPNGSVSHPFHPSGTACGDPSNTQCDKPDTCNGSGVCLSNREPSGTPCGSSVDTDCNGADTCDGNGVCDDNIEPFGTPCGSSADTFCTDPDTCNGLGNCLTNHAPNGTPCDDGLFCNINEACATGVCTGGSPRNCADTLPCTTDSCNESLDACENLLDAGSCLITGVCYTDGTLNPADDCQACDSNTEPNDWSLLPAGTACDDGNPCTGTGRPGIDPDTCDAVGACAGEEDPECNDTCDFAIPVVEGTTPSNNENRGPDDGEASCQPDSNNDVWFRYTARCTGEVFVSTTGSLFEPSNDPVLAVFDACPSLGGNEVACDDDSGVDLQAALVFLSQADTDYWIRVAGFEDNSGDIALNVLTVNDCVIDSVCYADGEVNPDNACQRCDPSLSTLDWSSQPEGTACGSPDNTDCDSPDACDGSGVCEPNFKPDGTQCTEDGIDCSFDVCGGGFCTHPPRPLGTACGDPADRECDNPDTCDAVSNCLPNYEQLGFPCGDRNRNQCDNPDICDGEGTCSSNHEPPGTPCDDEDICTGDDSCFEGVCAGTPIPAATQVDLLGPKAIAVIPQPRTSLAPVALRVTSPDWPCLNKYVGGVLRCENTGKRCSSTAECNACSETLGPCLTSAECPLPPSDVCLVSGNQCLPGALEPTDVNNDGFSDGNAGSLVDDPGDALVLLPTQWISAQRRCSKSFKPCTSNGQCDVGVCLAPECPGGVCSALGPCSVDAQNCPKFCSGSFSGCQTNANCPAGQTCVSASCSLDETCNPARLYLTGTDFVPSTTYEVWAECGPYVSPPGIGTTCLWADVNCNGFVNATDIQLILLGFQGRFLVPFESVDISPCTPNRIINVTDVQRALLAIQGQTYEETGCPVPCP